MAERRVPGAGLFALFLLVMAVWTIGAATRGPVERGTAPPPLYRVDVNRASEVELRVLPGIGPALAAAIVRERRAGGPFESPDALTRVPGIGPRTVERIREWIEAGGS